MPNAEGKGFVDYVLWGSDGLPLAVVEAKKTTVEPAVGQQQAKLYADCLEQMTGRRPVIFYTNGYQTWLWDDAAGYPPRRVEGFFTADELELMVQRRTGRLPLADAAIDKTIVERHYQQRAIRAVGEAFTAKQRAALLVMATGSGKTRTVIALVDQLMRAGWVKRVLFLADRTALVNQAVGAFKAHLPNVDHGQPGDREGRRRPGVRVDVPDDDEPDQRDRRRPAAVRAGLLRPDRDRRGPPVGLPEVPAPSSPGSTRCWSG